MRRSRLTIKGQITVPKQFRDVFGWAPHTELQFQRLPDGVKLTRPKGAKGRGARAVEKLRGAGDRKRSTDQIMALTRGERA